MPPTHDRIIGLNGQIKCGITTVNPLFVSDSQGVYGPDKGHKSYRFFHFEDDLAIPASSLRGMIRSVYEAATNSCFGVFEHDRVLSYHFEHNKSKILVPARVERIENDSFRLQLLTGSTGYIEKGPSEDDLAYAAWVKLYKKPIRKSKTDERYPTSNYSNRQVVPLTYGHKTHCYGLLEPMEHPPNKKLFNESINQKKFAFKFWNVVKIDIDSNNLPNPDEAKSQRIEQGWLCITNQNIENKHDERFFFRTEDNRDIEFIDLPRKIII